MEVVLTCVGCGKQFERKGYKYREQVRNNPNKEFYCSYRCKFPLHTNDPTKKYCSNCKTVKSKNEFNKANGRFDKLTPYCISCDKIIGKDYRVRNPEKLSNAHKKRRFNLRVKLFQILDSTKCVYCGFSMWSALQFDHKHGDGAQDKERFKDIDAFLRYYINHPEEAKEKLQIACANCNWIKRFKNEEAIHISERPQFLTLG